MIKLFHSSVLSIFLLFSTSAFGAWPKSDADFSRLPPYCKARSSGDKSQLYQTWKKRLGSNFIHYHHYCAGLHSINLANSSISKDEADKFRNEALKQIEYVLTHGKPDSLLMPKILYDRGQILERLGNNAEAMRAYQKGITLNPRLAPLYAALSDLLMKQNNKEEAVAVLKKGLHYKPDSKSLKKRMEKLNKHN